MVGATSVGVRWGRSWLLMATTVLLVSGGVVVVVGGLDVWCCVGRV